MSNITKALKLVKLLINPFYRKVLFKSGVAATVEHSDLIKFCAPASLIDVGTNKGQFSIAVRGIFPSVVIHGFEPLPAAADQFEKIFGDDANVHLHRYAIGRDRRSVDFYVADRDDSSSLLKPGSGQETAFGVTLSNKIEVQLSPLDDLVSLKDLPGPILLKIDVQGAELEVLQGCKNLHLVKYIYVELSFVELYEGQALFEEVRNHLASHNFHLRGFFNQAFTSEFGPTQADFLFIRS